MIPKIIWQTYETPYEELSDRIKSYTSSWSRINPEHDYRYFDAQAREKFVLEHFGQEWHDLFVSLPLGVMRADIWRCMAVYVYGGVYVDLDTMCYSQIENWIPSDSTFAIFPENFRTGMPQHGEHYATYMIAATPNNKILKSVINLMFERLQTPDYSFEHFVHYLTGPTMVTQVILETLNEEPQPGFIMLEHIDTYKYNSMDHVYASQRWKEDHVSWIDQRVEELDRNQ